MTTRKAPRLTKENYYSSETDGAYMSATWFKKFNSCEAEALAELTGSYAPDQNKTPLLVGNFVHSYFESDEAHQDFINQNKWELYGKKKASKADIEKGNVNDNNQALTNNLLSDYKKAESMIDRLKEFKQFDFFYNRDGCEKESIITGDLFGVPWKGKIDSLNVEKGYFCDLKTTAEIHKNFYNPDKHDYTKLWFDEYNYGLQMAAYKKMLQQKYHKPFECYIFAVDKTSSPAIEAMYVDMERIEKGWKEIEEYQPRLMNILNGNEDPVRCEHCDYCKATYQPFGFKTIDQVALEKY